jgi:hypothetical protein
VIWAIQYNRFAHQTAVRVSMSVVPTANIVTQVTTKHGQCGPNVILGYPRSLKKKQ